MKIVVTLIELKVLIEFYLHSNFYLLAELKFWDKTWFNKSRQVNTLVNETEI